MSENEASSSKSSSGGGPSSGSASSRLDSSGSSGSSAGMTSGPSPHGIESSSSSSGPQHSHISSLKTSACGASATDSAYGGSNTQSQRSGSGSGSRSSKSQISSNSSNNAGVEQSKSRKDKDPKKRKSKASVPPVHVPAPSDRPASADSNKQQGSGASSAAALMISAASTAVANVCSVGGTVEGGLALPGPVGDSAGNTGCGSTTLAGMNSIGITTTGTGLGSMGTRTKLPRAGCGIRGVTESRAVQAAQLSRALDCLKGTGLGTSKESQSSKCGKEDANTSSSWRSILLDPLEASLKKTFAHLEEVPTVKSKEAFIAAISLQDGIVVYVTPSLTDRLGYPAEMWCGRSLLDFIHPKDRLAFTNQITSKLLASLDKDDSSGYSFSSDDGLFPRGMIGSSSSPPNMLCSRLRMYRGLRTSGFGIVDKKTSYLPFRINLNLEKIRLPRENNADSKEATDAEDGSDEEDEYYLLAYAIPISTAYKSPEEKNSSGQFGLRHSANCLFSEVDMSSVPYLGHLPQDLLGTSALEFYHPNDLPELKKIYDSVIGRQGKSIRSKPYNFRAFNGCYVLLETDWTCFVNPWTKKLEFVAGHHRVLKGPSNPDVFASPPEGSTSLMDSMDAAAVENVKKLQAEICTILTGSPKPPQQQRHNNRVDTALLETATRRRKNLATLMGSLIDEVARVRGSNSCGNSCSSSSYARCKPQLLHSPVEGSLLGDASVVMGDISTHGGSGLDSNSADTPLSYSLLNYNQNLERYFQSQPKMIPSDGSGESSGTGSADSTKPDTKSQTPNMSSEEEGGCLGNAASSGTMPSSDSQKLSSSKSNSNSRSTDSQNGMSSDVEFKGLPLTKEMLGRHNEEMEKEFMQQHRELRNRSTPGRRPGQCHRKEPHGHGVKRGQAASWEEGGTGGRHKHPHMDDFCATPHCYQSPSTGTAPGPFNDWASLTGPSVIPSNLLPPFSVSATSPNQPSAVFSIPVANRGEVTNSLPAFYLAPGASTSRVGSQPVSMGSNQFMMSPHHQQHQHSAYSLQPYAFPHGVIYQPVMVPPMLFQPGLGVMVPAQPAIQIQRPTQRQQFQHERRQPYHLAGHHQEVPRQNYPESGSLSPPIDSYRQYQQEAGRQQQLHQPAQHRPLFKRTPPWMEAVDTSPELIYQYQVPGRNASDVLEADRERLRLLQQPSLLNHQLLQLYTEMEAEQRGNDLALEEGENSTSSSSAAEETNQKTRRELRRRSAEFRRTMLYEENAPFPQPTSPTD